MPTTPTDKQHEWIAQFCGIDPRTYSSVDAGIATKAGASNDATPTPATDNGAPTGAMPESSQIETVSSDTDTTEGAASGSGNTNVAGSDGSSLTNNPRFEHLI